MAAGNRWLSPFEFLERTSNMANEITDLSTSTFDETVSGADKPVVVDFWAEWCGPCKKIAPILTEIAGERSELSVTKLNVDDNPDIAMKFNVMSIPTLLVFDKGEVVGRITGAKSKGALLEEIDGFLATSH
jgi:thioredoxin 1